MLVRKTCRPWSGDWSSSNNDAHHIPIAPRTDSRSGSTTTDLASAFSIAIAGSFSPCPVTVTTIVESEGMSPLAWLFTIPAIPAADAGSTKMPSVLASSLCASSISSSETESIAPDDSAEALTACYQLAGFPILIAVATVSGESTTSPLTIGAAPSACHPIIIGSESECPASMYSL